MPAARYFISTVTVGAGGASTIDFTSIPSTYTDLVILCSLRNSGTSSDVYITLNSANGSDRWLYGYGTGVGSITNAKIYVEGGISSQTASTFSNSQVYIPNYNSSTTYKSVSIETVTENNATTNVITLLNAGLYSSNTAITSLSLVNTSGTFVQYCTATLYGIKNS